MLNAGYYYLPEYSVQRCQNYTDYDRAYSEALVHPEHFSLYDQTFWHNALFILIHTDEVHADHAE